MTIIYFNVSVDQKYQRIQIPLRLYEERKLEFVIGN